MSQPSRRAPGEPRSERLAALEQQALQRLGTIESGFFDEAMPRLSKAADHGGLWLAIACGMALSGRRGRRAAAQGLVALSLASVVTNVFLKPASRRTRPPAGLVPDTRVPLRAPVTTSFPSGHAASAAAFATAVLLEQPALGVALVPLSVVVAASRVVIGVHYPSDVIAGAVVGVVVGVAASAVPCGPGGSTSPPREAGR